ncbi:hypothetical protein MMC21_004531 [Puttea exsequens]|nr:hypothetical protein [Puttea exsequens]
MAGTGITPVLVGVADVKNKSGHAVEPMQLMLQSVLTAIEDTSLPLLAQTELQKSIDSIDVVATWTWPYSDLPGLLANKLECRHLEHKAYSEHGGHQPLKLVDEAARRISQGKGNVAVVTGGEALASLNACAAAGRFPPPEWTPPPEGTVPASPLTLTQSKEDLGSIHAIGLPIHIYPLYENAFRAQRKQSIEENNRESAQLYAEFAKIAARNKYAWNHDQLVPSEGRIATVTEGNRMICSPYPLLMNAFNSVNLAASCVLTSAEYAAHIGIPQSKWTYPLGGAGTSDANAFWHRPNFYSSPALSRSLDAGLGISKLDKADIQLYDFYSCFPIVPKLACHHLDLPFRNFAKPITLLGGLTSFGGAGNNYSLHALTAMVRRLRQGRGRNGLILANGGVLTYQHVLCLSSQPRSDGLSYPTQNPLAHDERVPAPSISIHAEGEARVEVNCTLEANSEKMATDNETQTYTVQFSRNGKPAKGFVIGRLCADGSRFIANAGNAATLKQLSSRVREPIGRLGWVQAGGNGRNLFVLDTGAML